MCKPPIGSSVVTCDNRVTAVSIAGEADWFGTAEKKYVNIPSTWFGRPRLGYRDQQLGPDLWVTLRFQNAPTVRRTYDVDFKVAPDLFRTPAIHTDTERGIHGPRFNSRSTCHDWTGFRVTLEAGRNTAEIRLGITVPAAGNNFYQVSARDCGQHVVTSEYIFTRRAICVRVFRGDDDRANPIDLTAVRTEFDRLGIEIDLAAETALPSIIKNVNGTATDLLNWVQACKTPYLNAYTSILEPFVVAIFVANQFNEKSDLTMTVPSVDVGPGATASRLNIVNGTGHAQPLWHFIETGRTWLRSATFVSNNPFDHMTPNIDITAGFLAAATEVNTNGVASSLDVNWPAVHGTAMRGTLTLNLSCGAFSTRLGFVPSGTNFIGLTRYNYSNLHALAALQHIIIHEMGHMIGMVAGGYAKPGRTTRKAAQDGVDEHAYYYDSVDNSFAVYDFLDCTRFQSHRGPHCHYPLTKPISDTSMPNASCVMLGQPGTTSAFCTHCVAAGRRVDFGPGFTNFYT